MTALPRAGGTVNRAYPIRSARTSGVVTVRRVPVGRTAGNCLRSGLACTPPEGGRRGPHRLTNPRAAHGSGCMAPCSLALLTMSARVKIPSLERLLDDAADSCHGCSGSLA